ncbi:hypothetical protein [Devosia sp. A16]|uniref:hypothetical protein n=1 Tax=Devosia sp. A16 TaxID=1736675 RepID=UPI0006D8583B|nr:hypothetical protein [Devosia sp. A16]
MRRAAVLVFSALAISTFASHAMAFQTGTIYKSKDGEWMCIDRWGNEIPPSSTGGWTVVTPPRKVGGDCNNQYVVRTGATLGAAADLAAPLLDSPVVRADKGMTEKGIK